jgi:hypothetical protein
MNLHPASDIIFSEYLTRLTLNPFRRADIISITNPNEEDIQKTIYLEGTRYNRDNRSCWVRDSDFDGKIVATLENMTLHPGDTLQVTVPVQLKATGERNFYIFKVRGEEDNLKR